MALVLSARNKTTLESEFIDFSYNRLSFMPDEHIFLNKYVYPPLTPEPLAPPITTFEIVGGLDVDDNPIFANTLEAGKRYEFRTRLVFPCDSGIYYTEFQLKMNCPETWGVSLWTNKTYISPYNYSDIALYPAGSQRFAKILPFEKNVVYSYALENDSSTTYYDMEISGVIDTTGADGQITFDCRNIFREAADDGNAFIISEKSIMKSDYCKFN